MPTRARQARPEARVFRGLIRALAVLGLACYAAALIWVASWLFPGRAALQPVRAEPVTVSLRPAEWTAYEDAVAGNLAVEVQNESLGWRHYLGARPGAVLKITRQVFARNVDADYSWIFTASRDFTYQAPECTYLSQTKAECTFEWRRGHANEPTRIGTLPQTVLASGDASDNAMNVQVSFVVKFDTLAVAREELDGTPVDFSAVRWGAAVEPLLLYPINNSEENDYDRLLAGDFGESLSHLRTLSGRGAYVQLTLCPSCMALEAYDCAEEATKSQYYCLGSTGDDQEISWSARRVDLEWQRAWAGWILSALIGGGFLTALGWLFKTARGTAKPPEPAVRRAMPSRSERRRARAVRSIERRKRRRRGGSAHS